MTAESQNKVGAVITGGGFGGLGILRAFARKGVPIVLLDHENCISRYSIFKKRYFRSPNPSGVEKYVSFLIQLAKKEGIRGWIIFPTSDEAVYVLARHKDILERYYRIPLPQWDIIRNVYMKKRTYEIAEKCGITIPKTYHISGLDQLAETDLRYPVVIKPSITHRFLGRTRIKAFRVDNIGELLKRYKQVSRIIGPSEIIIQDFIPGGPKNLYSFCPLFKNGRVITGVTARRARQRPMDFGRASTYVELVDIPELRAISEKFLGLINYYGIAEVEFMRDPRDKQYKLLEVNPRVWAWHTLAIAAGVDLPYMLYQDMCREKIEITPALRQVKWVRFITDLPTAFSEMISGNLTIHDYLASMKGKKVDAVFSVIDPIPFLFEILLAVTLVQNKF